MITNCCIIKQQPKHFPIQAAMSVHKMLDVNPNGGEKFTAFVLGVGGGGGGGVGERGGSGV